MVCPGLAEAWVGSCAVPVVATAVTPLSASPKAALVPPAVLTRSGPVGSPSGTVRFRPVLLE